MSRVRRIRGLRIGIFMVISNSLYQVYATGFSRKNGDSFRFIPFVSSISQPDRKNVTNRQPFTDL